MLTPGLNGLQGIVTSETPVFGHFPDLITQTAITHAEKSAAPVAAFVASLFNVAPHTAPLWPSNVPIQSPVSPCRNIGFPSENVTDKMGPPQILHNSSINVTELCGTHTTEVI